MAKIIWCEFLNQNAYDASLYPTNAKKILRLHAFEAFSEAVKYTDFSNFDKVIFVADHIKNYVERHYGEIPNAVVIPNGVQLDRFTMKKDLQPNNDIAWAGYITKKKGAQLILFLAESFPDYNFHIAGKFQEDDIAQYFLSQKPSNVIVYPWQYSLNSFYQNKTYILNTSPRESQGMTIMQGMACGLKPLVYDWIGAKEIYGPENVFKGIQDFERLLSEPVNPVSYRKFIEENYSFDAMMSKINPIVEELWLQHTSQESSNTLDQESQIQRRLIPGSLQQPKS